MVNNTFTCAVCHCVFDNKGTEEDGDKELSEFFPDTPKEECDVVCDDCWEKLKPDHPIYKENML